MPSFDLVVVGGGIVGLATAYQFGRRIPGRRVIILEKESRLAQHQSGHNSGVVHSGIYYKPGSPRAYNCRAGKRKMEEFCAAEGIAHEVCGKVIVAVDDSELPALARVFERGQANGVQCEMVGPERLRELEPHAAGVRAIHVGETGIVDYRQVCGRLAERIREREGKILTGARVTRMTQRPDSVIVHSTIGDMTAKCVVTCAGLQCDRVTAMSGQELDAKIVPFRGEYYALKPAAYGLCRNLIYPVPDAESHAEVIMSWRILFSVVVACGRLLFRRLRLNWLSERTQSYRRSAACLIVSLGGLSYDTTLIHRPIVSSVACNGASDHWILIMASSPQAHLKRL
jgi:(S)-2-hydroxyglutarate dehydrogenase